MIQAVRKTKQIVQIGMQRRSAPSVIKAKELVDSGILGKITLVKPMWNWNVSQAAEQLAACPASWTGSASWVRPTTAIWNRCGSALGAISGTTPGGNMTDQGTHLMDVVQWFTNSGPVKSAVCYRADGEEHRLRSAGRLLRGVRIREAHGHMDAELLQLVRERLVDPVPGR